MTTQREMLKINKLRDIIVKEGKINKMDLIFRTGISISYYEKLKPFLEYLYPHAVQYDKTEKMWRRIDSSDDISYRKDPA